jgi:hypothetical protein
LAAAMLTIENTEAKLRNRDHFYRAEQAEAQLAEAHKVVNRCAAQVGHPPIAPGEIGIESVAEAVERHAAHAREREEALDSITPQNLRAFAASEARLAIEQYLRQRDEWMLRCDKAEARAADLAQQLATAREQASDALNAVSFAEDAHNEMVGLKAQLNKLKTALLKYPEWLEDADGMEYGSDECSFCEAMRQDGHAEDCIWTDAQAALNPDARQEGKSE